MAAKKLSNKQLSYLRGLGHHLTPVAMVGREGITDRVINSVNEVILAHELIKVKIQNNCPVNKKEAAAELAGQTSATVIQVIGKVILLYRENRDRPGDKKIMLRKASM